jgi:uncharacterized protein YdeI (YjbR/CyaY-like superfamily)
MDVRHFRSPAELRRWLKAHHARERELHVGFWKKASGKGGITYPEALDEALCYGWIDGVRRSIDEDSYTIRFSPRKPTSNWSAVNIARVQELIASGRMRQPGLEAFERRDRSRSNAYSFEQADVALPRADQRTLRANAEAWSFWKAQPPGYRKVATWWVVSAKREETRRRRLETLIACSAKGERLPQISAPRRTGT